MENGNPSASSSVSRHVIADGQTIMMLTNTISSEEFAQLFTTIRRKPYGIFELPYLPDERIQITRDLLMYMDSNMTVDKELVACTVPEQSDMARFVMAAVNGQGEEARSFSVSYPYRLRFPSHAKDGVDYIKSLLGECAQINAWENSASEAEKFRLYDLANESKDNYLGEELNKQAALFAMNLKPSSPVVFVDYYEFFKAWGLKIRRSLQDEGALNRPDSAAKMIDRAKQANTYYDSEVALLLACSMEEAGKIGTGSCNVVRKEDIRALAAHLKFKSKSSLAYHYLKHFASDSVCEKNEVGKIHAEMADFVKKAREAISTPTSTLRVVPHQFVENGSCMEFTHNIGNMSIVTWVHHVNNQAVIATCMIKKYSNKK